jgi:hypothetical protein
MGLAGADVQDAVEATAVLVSIENMGDYLPTDDNGTQAPALNGFAKIRLIVLTSWRFFVNDMDESFRNLLEHLNKDAGGTLGLTTLRMSAPVPDSGKVTAALADEATGLSGPDADTLVGNALTAGYVPLDHQLREAGNTVSWYRGPLVPYGEIDPYITIPAPGPDALLRYDPLTGMFDASHAAAWQLGQLLALRSRAYSVALYEWKKTLGKGIAAQEELALLTQKLGGDDSGLLASFLAARARSVSLPDIPPIVSDFIGGLRLLKGVPFSYLVPDEGMLPTESLRLFSVDPNWIEALVDGAFSIGRASLDDLATDARHVETLRIRSSAAARRARTNDRPHLAALKANPPTDTLQQVTGILMRSQAVRGWPTLQIDGYTTTDDSQPPDVPKLRMQHLSKDVLLCMFDGPVKMIAIHEAPEALHSGVEFDAGPPVSTTLRRLTPPAGVQYKTDPNGGPPVATVNVRADKRTVQVQSTATSIQNKLKTDFGVDVEKFTSAEFSVEFVKGVVRVEFVVGG